MRERVSSRLPQGVQRDKRRAAAAAPQAGPAAHLLSRFGNRVAARMFQPEEDVEEAEVQADAGPALDPVSLPAATHWREKLGQNYKAIAAHMAFAVADKGVMTADVVTINGYIAARNADGNLADFRNVSHDAAVDAPKIRYTVDDRVYSTHAGGSQLYPISGGGVSSGAGAVDMATVLHRHNEMTLARYLTLAQLHLPPNALDADEKKTPNQMKTPAKKSLRLKFIAVTGNGVAPPAP